MKYIALRRQDFRSGEYSITPIRDEDKELIRIWRNDQMSILRQKSQISEEAQKKYFQEVVTPLFTNPEPTQLLFSFLQNTELIGYGGLVNISWQDKRAEMSFLVNPVKANNLAEYKSAMSAFISLMKQLVFEELEFNKVFTETYEFRKFHISTLEENGYIEEGRMRQHIFESGKFHDSILHSILKQDYVRA